MSGNPDDLTRRSTLKRIAAGAAVTMGAVGVSSTAAAADCYTYTSCDNNCPFNEPRVVTYECCDGDCRVLSEDCGVMCP